MIALFKKISIEANCIQISFVWLILRLVKCLNLEKCSTLLQLHKTGDLFRNIV